MSAKGFCTTSWLAGLVTGEPALVRSSSEAVVRFKYLLNTCFAVLFRKAQMLDYYVSAHFRKHLHKRRTLLDINQSYDLLHVEVEMY
jgi:hypothetical protein